MYQALINQAQMCRVMLEHLSQNTFPAYSCALLRCQHSPASLSAPFLVRAFSPIATHLSFSYSPVVSFYFCWRFFPLPFSYLSPSRLCRCPQLVLRLLFPWAWHGISRPFASATICNMLAHDKIVPPPRELRRRRVGELQYFTAADRDRLQSRVW